MMRYRDELGFLIMIAGVALIIFGPIVLDNRSNEAKDRACRDSIVCNPGDFGPMRIKDDTCVCLNSGRPK